MIFKTIHLYKAAVAISQDFNRHCTLCSPPSIARPLVGLSPRTSSAVACLASLLYFLYKVFSVKFSFLLMLLSSCSNSLKSFVVIFSQLLQPFNGLFSRTTWVSRYQKGKTNLDFTGARDSEWQWHQMDHMQVCTSLQTDNHIITVPQHSVFYRPDALPAAQPTASKH